MISFIRKIHSLMTVIKWTPKGLVLVLSTYMSELFILSRESNSLVDAGDDWAEERALLGVFGVDMTFEVRYSRKRLRDFATNMSAPVPSNQVRFEMLSVCRYGLEILARLLCTAMRPLALEYALAGRGLT
jgi:hypothetical protein